MVSRPPGIMRQWCAEAFIWAVVLTACWRRTLAAAEECGTPECACGTIGQVTKAVKEDFCKDPQYHVPPVLSQFTMEPQSGVYSGLEHKSIQLHCNISTEYKTVFQSFMWEHNGMVVNNHAPYNISTGTASSTLEIDKFSLDTQGDYRCRAEDGNYTLVSRTANLQLPKFYNWIDEAYLAQPHSDGIKLQVYNGASVLLECHPNTTESIIQHHWSKNDELIHPSATSDPFLLPTGSLLVRDVTLTPEKDLEYECRVTLLSVELVRTFTLTLANKGIPDGQPINFSVTPTSKEAIEGTNVTLYCIPKAVPRPVITWHKDGVPVKNHPSVETFGEGEVILIRNISMETGGNYTCVVSNGNHSANSTAHITVVAPPTAITISVRGGDSYMYNTDVFIPLEPENTMFTLVCNADSSGDLTANYHYSWAFRGNPVGSPVFHQEDNILTINSTSPWNVVGTVQCFVRNTAGSISTGIRILPQGKPNPPSNIEISRESLYYFQYDISWEDPISIGNQTITNHIVEVLVPSRWELCSCNVISYHKQLAFMANDYARYGSDIFFRVATTNTDGGQSDFKCVKTRIYIDSPPVPNVTIQQTPGRHDWRVDLTWHVDNCMYPSDLYTTHLKVNCDGRKLSDEEVYSQSDRETYSATVTVACCTTCDWTVTVTSIEEKAKQISGKIYSNKTNGSFQTGALAPTAPPTFDHVDRASSDGKTITASFTLPERNISCMPDHLIVKYSNNSGFAANTTIALSDYKPSMRSYTANVSLAQARCWEEYNISIAYGNDKGNSGFSNSTLTVRGPMEDDVHGFTSVTPRVVSSTVIALQLKLDEGMKCLMAMGFISGWVCNATAQDEKECGSTCGETQDYEEIGGTNQLIFTDLHPYQNYCFTAEIRITTSNTIVTSSTEMAQTQESVPKSEPRHLQAYPSLNGISITWQSPEKADWNGVLRYYNLTISFSNGSTIRLNHTNATSQNNRYTIPELDDHALGYTVTVSACTKIGCGPEARLESTAPPSATAESTTAESTTATSISDEQDTTLIIGVAAVAGGLALIAIVAVVMVVLIMKISCGPCRKQNAERQDNTIEEQPQFPAANAGFREEAIRHDDLVSVGNYQPQSEHSDDTTYQPLMRRFLNDIDENKPDGKVDDHIPELACSDEDHLAGARVGIPEFNHPQRSKHGREYSEHVILELESLPPADDEEEKEDESQPLLNSREAAVKSKSSKPRMSRDEPLLPRPKNKSKPLSPISLAAAQAFPSTNKPSTERFSPLGKPPSPIGPIPSLQCVPLGYLSEQAACNKQGRLPTRLPEGVILEAAYNSNRQQPSLSLVHCQFPTTNAPLDVTPMQQTQSNPHFVPSGYIEEEAINSRNPKQQPNSESWCIPTLQSDHIQLPTEGSTLKPHGSSYVREVPHRGSAQESFDLGVLQEELDDGDSDTSSVFQEETNLRDGYCTYPPPPGRPQHQSRNRSEMTSGIFSQSESPEPLESIPGFLKGASDSLKPLSLEPISLGATKSDSLEPTNSGSLEPTNSDSLEPLSSGFCNTQEVSSTSGSTDASLPVTKSSSFQSRRQSEGYYSEPPTPFVKKKVNFTFQDQDICSAAQEGSLLFPSMLYTTTVRASDAHYLDEPRMYGQFHGQESPAITLEQPLQSTQSIAQPSVCTPKSTCVSQCIPSDSLDLTIGTSTKRPHPSVTTGNVYHGQGMPTIQGSSYITAPESTPSVQLHSLSEESLLSSPKRLDLQQQQQCSPSSTNSSMVTCLYKRRSSTPQMGISSVAVTNTPKDSGLPSVQSFTSSDYVTEHSMKPPNPCTISQPNQRTISQPNQRTISQPNQHVISQLDQLPPLPKHNPSAPISSNSEYLPTPSALPTSSTEGSTLKPHGSSYVREVPHRGSAQESFDLGVLQEELDDGDSDTSSVFQEETNLRDGYCTYPPPPPPGRPQHQSRNRSEMTVIYPSNDASSPGHSTAMPHTVPSFSPSMAQASQEADTEPSSITVVQQKSSVSAHTRGYVLPSLLGLNTEAAVTNTNPSCCKTPPSLMGEGSQPPYKTNRSHLHTDEYVASPLPLNDTDTHGRTDFKGIVDSLEFLTQFS